MSTVRDLSGNGGRYGTGNPDPIQSNEGVEGVFTGKRADNMPLRATYGSTSFGIVPAAACTDLFDFNNTSANNKLFRILGITISGTVTAAENREVRIVRHAVSTGGTATLPGKIAHDSRDPTATAVIKAYTANPAIGAGLVVLHGGRLNLAPPANGAIDRLAWQFSWVNDKPLILSPGEAIGINFNGATFGAGAAIDIDWLWTEEPIV